MPSSHKTLIKLYFQAFLNSLVQQPSRNHLIQLHLAFSTAPHSLVQKQSKLLNIECNLLISTNLITQLISSKPQIPISDSCQGTYTSKSAENLPDVVAPQEKEKSPNPKRERMRDKLKNAFPSMNSSRNPDDGLVFGVELSLVERDDKLQVPRFVAECVRILKEQENIETSGLYRASGNKNSIENIKKKLNEKRSPKKYEFLKKQDVHSLTGSLKLFFRELKSPLIAKDVYESCVQQTKGEFKAISVCYDLLIKFLKNAFR